ncbi:AAA family ATPase [Pararhizobium sp. DWP1-1-3]|uniref:AAA family ATPase n=1 Tax=Pararhizobium sp. DWP1-1-3 TaxID=2804652 RepID=UPI003CF24100
MTAKLSEGDRAKGAERISQLLNGFMSQLVNHIEASGGTVFNFGGDSLLAGWRALSADEIAQATWRSCDCAVRIRERFEVPTMPEGAIQLRTAVGAGDIALLHLMPSASQRWLVVSGDCFSQVDHCGQLSDAGEILLSSDAWRLVIRRATGQPGREGTIRFEGIEPYPMVESRKVKVPAVSKNLGIYLPKALRDRLLSPLSEWLADLRSVTAMFAHIPGHELDTDLDRLNELVALSISIVTNAGGEVLHTLLHSSGLEVVAVFGLPGGTHTDNARRAVLAALRFSSELDGAGHGLSVGIATGETFCGALGAAHRSDYTVVGEAANTAARLASVAAGRILVDSATAHETAGHVTFAGPWSLSVPGVRGGVAAFVPLSAQGGVVSAGAPALVNRVSELDVLTRYVDESGSEKAGVLVIRGDPGIGKSALLRTFVERCRDRGLRVLVGGADDIERAAPYFAWRAIIRELIGLGDLRGLEATEKVHRFFDSRPDLAPLAPLLNDAMDLTLPETAEMQAMSGDGRSHNLRKLLYKLLTGMTQPVGLIVLEDVHWLDEVSGLLLGRLISGAVPIPIIVSTRNAETAGDLQRWAGLQEFALQSLDLMPLGFEDTTDLVRSFMRSDSPSGGFDEMVYAQSAGNPFLIGEICRMISERGAMSGGSAAATPISGNRPSESALLSIAKVTVLSRTDRLPPDQQVLLKLASALGSTFAAADLAALPPIQQTDPNIGECLSRLQNAHLIKPAADRPDHFVFSHAIIRKAIYDSMLAEQRREAHRAIARTMEESRQPDNAENLPLILSHWERAEEAALSFNYLDRVAELRLRQFDNEVVVELINRFFRTAKELAIEINPARRAAACFLLGEASLNLGRAVPARQAYEEGLRLSGVPLPGSFASLALHLVLDVGEQVWRRLRHRDATWVLKREIAQSQSDPFLLAAKAHEDLTRIYYFTSEKLRLVHATLRATNLAERNTLVSPTMAVNYASLGAICGVIPLRRQAAHYSRIASALSDRVDRPGTRVRVHLLAGLYQTSIGSWNEAKDEFEAGLGHAAAVGDLRRWCELAVGLETICGPWLLTPAFNGIAPWELLVTRICDEGRRRGDIQVLGCGLLGGIRGHAALGDREAMAPMLDELGLIITDRAGGLELVHCVEGASFLAEQAHGHDAREAARSWFDRGMQWCADLNPAMKTRTLPALVRLFDVAIEQGDDKLMAASSVLAKLWRFARVYPVGRPAALLAEATLRGRLGQTRRAERAASEAFDEAVRLAAPAMAAAALQHPAGPADAAHRRQFEELLAGTAAPWGDVIRIDNGGVDFRAPPPAAPTLRQRGWQ